MHLSPKCCVLFLFAFCYRDIRNEYTVGVSPINFLYLLSQIVALPRSLSYPFVLENKLEQNVALVETIENSISRAGMNEAQLVEHFLTCMEPWVLSPAPHKPGHGGSHL